MQWHPDEWGNITWIKVKPTQVWKPDVVPYNDMDQEKGDVSEKYKKLIRVDSNGVNTWSLPIVYTLACKIEVRFFGEQRSG